MSSLSTLLGSVTRRSGFDCMALLIVMSALSLPLQALLLTPLFTSQPVIHIINEKHLIEIYIFLVVYYLTKHFLCLLSLSLGAIKYQSKASIHDLTPSNTTSIVKCYPCGTSEVSLELFFNIRSL